MSKFWCNSITFTGANYQYTFFHRIYHVYELIKNNNYNPFDFKTHVYGSIFIGRYPAYPKDTPWYRFKNFIKLVIYAYNYVPETSKYWEANKSRLSCQENQLKALGITGENNKPLIQTEEATCVLWHEDKSNDVLDTFTSFIEKS